MVASACCWVSPVNPWANVRPSLWLVPISSGTRLYLPEATACAAGTGSSGPPEMNKGW